MANPDCTIIIPNFNGETMLSRTMPSVIAACENYQGVCEILVVDDHSTDTSLPYLQSMVPKVRLHIHSSNQGFSRSIDSGVANSRSELLMLLNSDVQIDINCLNHLASCFEETNVFAAGPLIYNESQGLLANSWVPPELNRGHIRSKQWLSNGLIERQQETLNTLYCSGGSMMVRRSRFLELAGFAKVFEPFYSEDFDLGLRAWTRGWASVVNTRGKVIHFDRGTIESHFDSNYVKYVQRRNRLLLEWIHLPMPYLILVNLPLITLQLLGECILLDTKNMRGFASALARWRQVLERRRKVSQQRVLEFNDVLAAANAKLP